MDFKILLSITVRNVDRAITVPRRKPEGDHDSNPQSQAGHARIFKFRGPVPTQRPVQTKSSQSIVFWYVTFLKLIFTRQQSFALLADLL